MQIVADLLALTICRRQSLATQPILAVLKIANLDLGLTLIVLDAVLNVCAGPNELSFSLQPVVVNHAAMVKTLAPASYRITMDAKIILFHVLRNHALIHLGANGVLVALPATLKVMLHHNNAVTVN